MSYGLTNAGGAASPNLGTKTITANGTYSAATDGLDGYSEVTANVQPTYTVNAVNLTSSELSIDNRAVVDLEPATQASDTTTILPSTSSWAETYDPFGRIIISNSYNNGTIYSRDLATNTFTKIADNLFNSNTVWIAGFYDSETGLSIFKKAVLSNHTYYSTCIDPAKPYLFTRETVVTSIISPLGYGFYSDKGSTIIKDDYAYTVDASQPSAGIFMIHKYGNNYYAFGSGADNALRILSVDTGQHTMTVVATFSNYGNLPIIANDSTGRYVFSWGGDVIDMTTYSIVDSLANYHTYDNISINGIVDKVVFSWADRSTNPALLKYEVWSFNNGVMTKDASYDTTNYPTGANSFYNIDASGSLIYCSTDNGANLLHYRTIAKPARYTAKPFSQIGDASVIGTAGEAISAGNTGNVIIGTLINPTVTATNNSSYDRVANEKVWLNENNGSYEIINANSASFSSASFNGVCKEAIAIGSSGTVEAIVDGTVVPHWTRDFSVNHGTVDDGNRLYTAANASEEANIYKAGTASWSNNCIVQVKAKFISYSPSGALSLAMLGAGSDRLVEQTSFRVKLAASSSKISAAINNGSYVWADITQFAPSLNQWYWLKLAITPSSISTSYSLDGSSWVTGETKNAGTSSFSSTNLILLGSSYTGYSGVVFDLAECYIEADGVKVWEPYTEVIE